MLAFAVWIVSALSSCAPTVFVDSVENGTATVISLESGAAWNTAVKYLPTGAAEGDTVTLCGYRKPVDVEAKRAELGASDPGGDINLDAPVTAEVR